MTKFVVNIPKPAANLLITETDILIQPYPVSLISDFSAGQTRAVLAQASRIFAPYNQYANQDRQGRVGKYQFNSATLEALGYLKTGTVDGVKNQPGANALAINTGSNWTGQNQINSVTDWFNSPGIQERSVVDLYLYNCQKLKDLSALIVTMEPNKLAGLLLVAHIAGVSEALRLLNYNLGKIATLDGALDNLNQYFYAGSSAYDFGTQVEKA